MNRNVRGFTIVELLIVIVVIAILAAITIVTFNGIQERARIAQAETELKALSSAVRIARIQNERVLMQITGDDHTKSSCMQSANVVRADLDTLSKSHTCWTDYVAAIEAIEVASETPLEGLKDGSPWGGPYLIDENEGENSAAYPASPCQEDFVNAFSGSTRKVQHRVPLHRGGCTPGDSTYFVTL